MSFGDYRRRAPGRSWLHIAFFYGFVTGTVRTMLRVLYRLRWEGLENLPAEGAIIVVANHQSHFDPPMVSSLLDDRPVGFLARETLFTFKPFGALIRLIGAIPLKRGRTAAAALREAVGELEAGRCMLVFPEGTRTPDGTLRPFKSGALFLARKTGAVVLPVAVEGLWDVWPRKRRFPHLRGRIGVRIGTPISAAELTALGDREASDMLRRLIEQMRLEIRQRLRAESDGRRPRPGKADVAYWEVEETAGAEGAADRERSEQSA